MTSLRVVQWRYVDCWGCFVAVRLLRCVLHGQWYGRDFGVCFLVWLKLLRGKSCLTESWGGRRL